MNNTWLAISLLIVSACASKPVAPVKVQSKEPHYVEDVTFHPKAIAPAFTSRHPVLCFDEGHNNLAVHRGRYQPVLGLLESDGYLTRHESQAFSKDALKECDLLYISAALGGPDYHQRGLAARSAFQLSEIKAIHAWVEKGGGLLLATDHRPMGDAMEALIESFGVKGSLVNIKDPSHPIAPFTEPGVFEITSDEMDANHPIIRGRDESERLHRIYFFYGEAFKVPSQDAFLTASKDADLAAGAEGVSSQDFRALGAAFQVKKGRVVVIGDATILTSKLDDSVNEKTGINRAGSDNVQFALNTFRWLALSTDR